MRADELSRQTARVLDRVKAGESLEITEHGLPVARLVPANTTTTGSPLLDRLIEQGRAVAAESPGPLPPTPRWDIPADSAALSVALTDLHCDERY